MGYSVRIDHVERKIWQKFHVHHGDVPPIMGFHGTRNTLAEMFGELEFNIGAEVGVQRGLYSSVLLANNPKLKLYLVDSYTPFTHHRQEWQDRQYAAALRHTKGKDVEFIKKPSVEAAKDIPDGSLDFVYIDALHDFDSVIADILAWVPKVKKGGIVSGHDYEHYYSCGVVQAVDAYVQAHNIALYYITPKDPPRSWFFSKL